MDNILQQNILFFMAIITLTIVIITSLSILIKNRICRTFTCENISAATSVVMAIAAVVGAITGLLANQTFYNDVTEKEEVIEAGVIIDQVELDISEKDIQDILRNK